MEPGEIDPIKYGAMWQRVRDYERRFEEMDKKLDKLSGDIEALTAMANKSKGGLWAGMALVSLFSGTVSWVVAHMKG